MPAGGEIFEHVFATEVRPPGTIVNGDLKGNLLKFSSANTAGESEPLRAEADYEITAPVIGLTKGVEEVVRGATAVNGPNGPDVDHVAVEEGDEATYRVDLGNSGGQEAVELEVWDVLPAAYSCADVGTISDGGSCESGGPGDHIVWVAPSLAAEATKTLTYAVTVPAEVGPGRTLTNTAGVRQFQSESNTGTDFTYTPAENIDRPTRRTKRARRRGPQRGLHCRGGRRQTRTTGTVAEAGNNAASQATIGERIAYTITATIPEGTTSAARPS